jgi:hypothetical protein
MVYFTPASTRRSRLPAISDAVPVRIGPSCIIPGNFELKEDTIVSKLRYEHFKSSLPDDKVRNTHKEHTGSICSARSQKITGATLAGYKEQDRYVKSRAEWSSKQTGRTSPPLWKQEHSAAKPSPPNPQRLPHAIFDPWGQMVDISSDEYPFTTWGFAYGGPTPSNPSNNSSAGTAPEAGPGDQVTLNVSAGENEQVAGVATAFGYVATYLSPPTNPALAADLPSGAWLKISCSPSVTYWPQWSATYDPATFWIVDSAQLQLQASIILMIYDQAWNFVSSVSSQPVSFYTLDSFEGSSPAFDITPDELVPLSLNSAASMNNNYGIFIQFFAQAQASGASTGALVPGSNASISLTATVPAIQIEAACLPL